MQYFGICLVIMMWFLFASAYTNRNHWLTLRTIVMLSIEPLVLILLVWTNDFHRLIWVESRFIDSNSPLVNTYGVVFWINAAYSYILLFTGALFLVQFLLSSPYIHRGQTISLLIGVLAPWLGNAVYLSKMNPIPFLDLTPFGFTISGIAVGWGLFRYRLLDILPIARNMVIENMSDSMFVIDSQNLIADVNPAAIALLRYAPEQVIGKPAGKVFDPWPEIISQCMDGSEGTTEIDLNMPGEVDNDHDGSKQSFELHVSSLKDRIGIDIGRTLTLRDISDRKRVESALQESEARYRRLTEVTIEGILFHEQGKILDGNPALVQMFGYDDFSEVAGDNILAFVAPEEHEYVIEQVQKSGIVEYETLGLRKDGTVFPLEVSARTYELHGRKMRVGVLRDITHHKNTEMEIFQRQRYLELLNEITLTAIRVTESQTMMQMLADRMGELLEADGCYITLWDEETQRTIPIAAYGTLRESYRNMPSEPGERTVTWYALRAGHSLVIDDVFNSLYVKISIAVNFPTRSMLALPLIVEENKLGAVLIAFNQPHQFSDEEIARGEQAAGQIALAIAKEKSFEDQQRRMRELDMIFNVSSSFAIASLQPQEIAQVITRQFVNNLNITECSISLYDPQQETLLTIADNYIENGKEYIHEEWIGRILSVSDFPATARVIKTLTPLVVHARDPNADPAELSYMEKYEISTLAVLPLVSKGRIIGIMELETSEEDRRFSQEEINLAMTLANQAAVALENAQLFAQIQELAITDGLTGLHNRRHFFILGEQEFNRAARYNHSLSAIMLDIDDFKHVNDTFGHAVGDRVLHNLAVDFSRHLRDVDIFGRYGGEEFAIILPETGLNCGYKAAERLRSYIANHPIVVNSHPISITVSIGVAELTKDIRTLDALLVQADSALYKAKNSGKNCVATI